MILDNRAVEPVFLLVLLLKFRLYYYMNDVS